jgi:molybdopterin molybdotransferase
MLSVDEAISSLLASSSTLVDSESMDLIEARGRVLASDIVAPIFVPPADNSAMDGYVVRHAEWPGPETALSLSQRITAGSVPDPLQEGTAARIFTGAEVPEGGDTVVMQENCEEGDGAVRILELPGHGANIRPRGQDIEAGQHVLKAGQRLRAQDQGLVASLGIDRVEVRKRLKVAILSTGDELVEPGQDASPGQIYNSNRFTMSAQLASWGFEVVDLGVVRDDPVAVRLIMMKAAERADVIVTSGGVSVGEEDHVRDVVADLGSLDLWRIAIKPGKPFAFGQVLGKPFLGLPGNPVSVFVTLLVVARPFLLACQGASDTTLHPLLQRARFSKRGSQREDYLRVRLLEDGLELFPNMSSGVLYSTTWGDGGVRQRVGQDINEGELVEFLPWPSFN